MYTYLLVVTNALEAFDDEFGVLGGHLAVGVGVRLGLGGHLACTSLWMLVLVRFYYF